MKFSITTITFVAAALPVAWSLPTSLAVEPHPVASCAANLCLLDEPVPQTFDGCSPSDLACICRLQQTEVTRYVTKVEPCINDPARGGKACTAGAIYEYKSLLASVCKSSFSKNVTWVSPP